MFTKYITLVIQIILVIAGVIVFSYFDPFNIFNTKKLKVKDTTTMVESIREIGELITAEYYGEVIQSSTDSIVITIQNLQDSVKRKIEIFEADVLEALGEINAEHGGSKNEIKKAKHVVKFFAEEYPELQQHAIYPHYLRLMETKLKTKNINARREKEILHEVFKQVRDNKLQTFGTLAVSEDYLEKYFGLTKKEMKGLVRNKLVMLGRGWVKAGIDFKNFDHDNIRFVEGSDKILLMRHKARIISATINPWFIPKKKITGFEYLFVGRNFKKSDDPGQLERVKKAKRDCLLSLKQQAMTAGILSQAEKNAEYSLSRFFSLLMGREVTVELFGHPLDAYRSEFEGTDKILTKNEIPSIDSLITAYMDSTLFSALKFADAMAEMKTENIPVSVQGMSWEAQALYLNISKDSLYTRAEQKRIKDFESRQSTEKDLFYYVVNSCRKELLEKIQMSDTLSSDASLTMAKVKTLLESGTIGFVLHESEFKKSRERNHEALRAALSGLRLDAVQ